MATRSSILAWRTPCTEEPGGLQSQQEEQTDKSETILLPTSRNNGKTKFLIHVLFERKEKKSPR